MQLSRTVAVPLRVTPEQAAAFAALRPLVTAAYNDAAAHAWEHETRNAVDLHHEVYRTLRERHGLPSQFVCNAQRLAWGSVAAQRKRRAAGKPCAVPHAERIPVPYDARSMSVRPDRGRATFATLGRRIEVPFRRHRQLARYADWKTDSGRVRQRSDGSWELLLTLTKEVLDVEPAKDAVVVGCDRGIVNPAVLSTGRFLGDRRWHATDRRYFRTQRALQRKGTRSAKRRLKQRSRKWSRFRAWCDHNVTTQIVRSLTPSTVLALEDLTHIRTRMRRVDRRTKRRMHAWSFRRQQEMLAYKAPASGIVVAYVDPRYTSQKCSACGHIDKKNRRSQSRFDCVSCGHLEHADLNAAKNVAANWTASRNNGGPTVEAREGHVNPPHATHAKDPRSQKPGTDLSGSGVAKGSRHRRGLKSHGL